MNRQLAEILRRRAPQGVSIIDGLGEVPVYNQDLDAEVLARLDGAIRTLVDYDQESAAA